MLDDAPLSDRAPATYFAPAGRDTPEEFQRKVSALQSLPLLGSALDAIPSMVMILNTNRQIVAANEALFKVLQATLPVVLQKRPGEAVGCCRAKDGPDGCGTAVHCVTCGAVHAILESQKTASQVTRECRILVETPSGFSPLDLRVTATPLAVGADQFIVVAIECSSEDDRVAFAVHNPEVMPSEVQLQVFQRSFSTKAETGRGIGTYSMRLFGERYLGGTMSFISRESEGTTFRLTIPTSLPLV